MNFSIHAKYLFLELFILSLQKLRQVFRPSLGEVATVSQAEEEPIEGVSMETCSTSPPRPLQTHQQDVADYIRLLMEKVRDLTLGEDWAAPLITEVSYMSPMINSPIHSKFFCFVLLNSLLHFQALQKICLRSHIRSMADLLHANVIQQLEVALLGSPAAQVLELLSGGWMQTKLVPMTTSV